MNVGRVLAGTGEVVHYALLFLWAILCPGAVLAPCRHEIATKKRPVRVAA